MYMCIRVCNVVNSLLEISAHVLLVTRDYVVNRAPPRRYPTSP